MWQGLFVLAPLVLGIQATSPSCRCFPNEPCWPSPQQWSEFNATLGGKLISTVPIGSVCHTHGEYAAYDPDACADLISDWAYPVTHYETSSSPMASWFANFSCDPFLAPDIPAIWAQCSGLLSTLNTLRFTNKHNIRIVVRNTGHDYLGKSTAPGAVALWTHHLKDTQHLEYSSAHYNGSAMRLGAGIQGFDAMAAAHAQDKVVVTGNCESVGIAGGYTQGGGHGQLASQFGLAADQALEWEVVTADGKLLTASPTENADLYWALSGGGGGTYAVVLSVTVKAYPELFTSSATLTFDGSGMVTEFWEAVQTFVVDTLPLLDAGAVAIWAIYGSTFSLTPIALPGGRRDELQKALAPTLALLKQSNISYSYDAQEFPTFWASFQAMNPHSNITEAQIGGRLMPRSTVESDPAALISAIRGIAEEGVVVSGVSLNVSRSTFPFNAVNPAWRDAAISFVLGTYVMTTPHFPLPLLNSTNTLISTYNYTSPKVDVQCQSLMTDSLIPRLAALSPGGGAYLNEADWKQPDWQSVFYGYKYPLLKSIKEKYDPEHVFYARTAVGSESWYEEWDGQLCRYE
ncbi:FAD-linked oxidoreductase sor8 [Penicillium maclennaniae]|uniref:FAD-linked oxidoreductase sor8 n=1 Tax=Penicillium maclennaniae TaxID=1343394 RepID=UPI00253FA4C1|nr:FAD-linked oxidoreductase sor8 [Penicillium maclennaniae]KAJ5662168.1 FAD-linked oxidoreductase sor8 [Penicillium maclennaniae]